MQKTGEPENDAGFLKHVAMQLNCSYLYPSKPRLVVTFFRLHYTSNNLKKSVISQVVGGFYATYTRPYSNSTCEPTHALHVH